MPWKDNWFSIVNLLIFCSQYNVCIRLNPYNTYYFIMCLFNQSTKYVRGLTVSLKNCVLFCIKKLRAHYFCTSIRLLKMLFLNVTDVIWLSPLYYSTSQINVYRGHWLYQVLIVSTVRRLLQSYNIIESCSSVLLNHSS